MASSLSNSRPFADITSIEEFIERQENKNTKKKTEQNVALLKEFLRLKDESRPVEEIPPHELSSFISEFIITVRKKENHEDYEPNSLRAMMASFERYLKKKKQITSWLIRLYDFYSLVGKNHKLTRSRSFV